MSPTLRRAAILLSSLPPQTASRLLAQMDPPQVRQIRAAISQLQDVDPLERRRALDEFRQMQGQQQQQQTDSFETLFSAAAAQNAARANARPDAAPPQVAEAPEETTGPFGFLQELADDDIVGVLLGEGPQTIAAVMSGLTASKASRLLERIPAPRRAEVVQRLATLDMVPDETAEEIAASLRQILLASGKEHARGDGPRALLRILGELSANQRDSVLAAVETVDPMLFESLRRRHAPSDQQAATEEASSLPDAADTDPTAPPHDSLAAAGAGETAQAIPEITFDSIQQRTPAQLREFLAELPGDVAILALCAMRPNVVDRVLEALPSRVARDTRRRMRRCQGVAPSQLEHARHLFLKVARRHERRSQDSVLAAA